MKKILILLFIFSIFGVDKYFDKDENAASNDNSIPVVNTNLDVASEAALLVEYNSGKVLYSKNEEVKLYPASMTKMMGLYLVLDAIDNNLMSLNDDVVVSSKAASMGGTQIFLQPNEVTQVKWCTKEEILELIENDKVPRGYAYILNKYIN